MSDRWFPYSQQFVVKGAPTMIDRLLRREPKTVPLVGGLVTIREAVTLKTRFPRGHEDLPLVAFDETGRGAHLGLHPYLTDRNGRVTVWLKRGRYDIQVHDPRGRVNDTFGHVVIEGDDWGPIEGWPKAVEVGR